MTKRKPFIYQGVELAPCAVAKARFALGITSQKPTNGKTGSLKYWKKTIQAVYEDNLTSCKHSVESAISRYKELFSK